MKPSPGRIKYMKLIKQANQIIKNFLWQQQNVGYADVFNAMLDENGQPRSELFKEDSLHVNDKGYATWQKTIQPYLLKP
jgi:lysophospholipase L1-like esterase